MIIDKKDFTKEDIIESEQFSYRVLTNLDIKQCCEIAANAFVKYEPMTSQKGMTYEQIYQIVNIDAEIGVKYGTCVVAKEKTT